MVSINDVLLASFDSLQVNVDTLILHKSKENELKQYTKKGKWNGLTVSYTDEISEDSFLFTVNKIF
ncbi:hypothetical protein [Tenacibaculum phage JQ]|nr:hypothetical protein [Tenacibaculum phage JQ]